MGAIPHSVVSEGRGGPGPPLPHLSLAKRCGTRETVRQTRAGEPVTPRDVAQLRTRLQAIATAALTLATHAEDLHGLAFERHVGATERVSGGDHHPGVENIGDAKARLLWARLEEAARPMELTVRALGWAVANHLSRGGSAEETRGSLILHQEYAEALGRQRRRRTAGEYTPERMVDQPPHPRGGVA
jgi:hypothetical protein